MAEAFAGRDVVAKSKGQEDSGREAADCSGGSEER
jgi:hypothetical protein